MWAFFVSVGSACKNPRSTKLPSAILDARAKRRRPQGERQRRESVPLHESQSARSDLRESAALRIQWVGVRLNRPGHPGIPTPSPAQSSPTNKPAGSGLFPTGQPSTRDTVKGHPTTPDQQRELSALPGPEHLANQHTAPGHRIPANQGLFLTDTAEQGHHALVNHVALQVHIRLVGDG